MGAKFKVHKKIKLFVNDDISLDLVIDEKILQERKITENKLREAFSSTFKIFFNDFLDEEKHCGVVVVDKSGNVQQYFYTIKEDQNEP